jgi:hypothetical protein
MDLDSGGPKTYGSCRSGSATLFTTTVFVDYIRNIRISEMVFFLPIPIKFAEN